MKFAAVDVRQAASAADIVYESLRKAIIEGALAEGESLRQEEIAQMFNTSRIPVREALSRLEQHGLITTQRYKGAVVAGLSIEEISKGLSLPRGEVELVLSLVTFLQNRGRSDSLKET